MIKQRPIGIIPRRQQRRMNFFPFAYPQWNVHKRRTTSNSIDYRCNYRENIGTIILISCELKLDRINGVRITLGNQWSCRGKRESRKKATTAEKTQTRHVNRKTELHNGNWSRFRFITLTKIEATNVGDTWRINVALLPRRVSFVRRRIIRRRTCAFIETVTVGFRHLLITLVRFDRARNTCCLVPWRTVFRRHTPWWIGGPPSRLATVFRRRPPPSIYRRNERFAKRRFIRKSMPVLRLFSFVSNGQSTRHATTYDDNVPDNVVPVYSVW